MRVDIANTVAECPDDCPDAELSVELAPICDMNGDTVSRIAYIECSHSAVCARMRGAEDGS